MLPYNFFERVIYEIDLKNTFPDDFSPPIVLYEPELSGSFYFTMLHPSNQSLAEKSLKGVFNTSINSDSYGNILLTSVDTVIVSVVSTLTNVILSQPFVSNGKWYTQASDINGNIIKNKSCIVTYYYI